MAEIKIFNLIKETRTMTTHPREEMQVLPGVFQPFLTWMTGVPHSKEVRPVKWSPLLAFLLAVTQIVLGMFISFYAVSSGSWISLLLLFFSWPLTAGGMRRLDVILIHQSLHNMVVRSKLGNRIIGEVLTTLLWRAPYDGNREEHLTHHQYPCTELDIDTKYLRGTGFTPGMSKREFHRYLISNLLSPKHHGGFFWGRLKNNLFGRAPLYRRLMSWLYMLALLVLLAVSGQWVYWLVLWVVPVSLGFQCATFLYTHTEHKWWIDQHPGDSDPNAPPVSDEEKAKGPYRKVSRAVRDQLSFGRLCGDSVPQKNGRGYWSYQWAWCVWWFRVVFVHMPHRLFVLVGDTIQHDVHHIHPGCDWANSDLVRRDDIAGDSKRYYDVWGSLLDHLYYAACVDVKADQQEQATVAEAG